MLLVPGALAGQQVRTAVLPQDITVGDVFRIEILVLPLDSGNVVFPDSLVLPSDLEPAGRREVRVDTLAGGIRWRATYPVAGWRPGSHALGPASVALLVGGRRRFAEASFPAVIIRSVLPADTAGIEPQPARDVIGADRLWWPWLAGAALLALTGALGTYWLRRRRRPAVPAAPPVRFSPREEALRQLERARSGGALAKSDYKTFYSDVSSALRGYLAAVDPSLGTDLTTTELELALLARAQAQRTAELSRVLHAADLVKFARAETTVEQALDDWRLARVWVEGYDPGALPRAA